MTDTYNQAYNKYQANSMAIGLGASEGFWKSVRYRPRYSNRAVSGSIQSQL